MIDPNGNDFFKSFGAVDFEACLEKELALTQNDQHETGDKELVKIGETPAE